MRTVASQQTNPVQAIASLEWRLQLHSKGYWFSLLVLIGYILFGLTDNWELAPGNLAAQLADGVVPIIFVVAGFVTLNCTGREQTEQFSEVFYTLPVDSRAIYTGKTLGAALSLLPHFGCVAAIFLVPIIGQGYIDATVASAWALAVGQMILAGLGGLSVAMFLTAVFRNVRLRYVVLLFWLFGMMGLNGLARIDGFNLVLGLSFLTIDSVPYGFSALNGFFRYQRGHSASLRWAAAPLNSALQQALWNRSHGHGFYEESPVLAGAASYLTLLWLDHIGAGVSEQALARYAQTAANTEAPNTTQRRIAEVVLELHRQKQAGGSALVGKTLRQLLELAAQRAVTWDDWEAVYSGQ